MRIILVTFLLFVIDILNAQESRFKEGETLNVWASSGLNMRDKPDAKAAKISTIPYGAKVVVQPNIGLKIPFEVEGFKGFIVKGYWLLVKYGNTEGFVFDGFLSRLPAPKPREQDIGIETYLDAQIGKVGNEYEIKVQNPEFDTVLRPTKSNEKYEKFDYFSFKQKYKQGVLYDFRRGEGGFSMNIIFPNLILYEGYILAKKYFFDDESHIFTFDKKEKKVNMLLKESGAGCEYDIQQIGNKIIIDGGCGC